MKPLSPVCCKSCGSLDCREVLDLGEQPLANRLLREDELDEVEPKYSLKLWVCQHCWLLQIGDLVDPEALFSDYVYFSSVSTTVLENARENVTNRIEESSLDGDSFVVEIASNDGYLLKSYQQAGVPCLGIEPAANVAKVAKEKQGIETLVDFFSQSLASQLASEGKQADVVHANNVFAHVPDTNDFVEGLGTLLKPRGYAVLEFPYAGDLIQKVEFDTIYHEHVFYFSLYPLLRLFQRHGMEIFRVERLPIHGGSLRIFAAKAGAFDVEFSVDQLLQSELQLGIDSFCFYADFSKQTEKIKADLLTAINHAKKQGQSVSAYGASAKGSTLLNYVSPPDGSINFVVDRSAAKVGLFTPGLHLPIRPTTTLLEAQPDYTLLLTWNFKKEIYSQQSEYRSRGGRFIVPIPSVCIE